MTNGFFNKLKYDADSNIQQCRYIVLIVKNNNCSLCKALPRLTFTNIYLLNLKRKGLLYRRP